MERIASDFIDSWLMPLPLALVLLGVGCALLWWRKSASGRLLATGAWLILALCSCTALSDLLLLPLEERYPKWNGADDDLAFVVVMGAAVQDAPRLPETNRPNTAGIYRLVEGVNVYRANPGSKLIVSGGPTGGEESFAEVGARVARALGVPAADVLLQPRSRNTEEEVGLLAPMVGAARFAVVTSAAHMPRAMRLFNAAGLRPLAVPTHFLDRYNPHPQWYDLNAPGTDGLARMQFALHEYIGLLWLELKGLAGPKPVEGQSTGG